MEKNGSKSFQLWFPLLAVHGSQQLISLKIFRVLTNLTGALEQFKYQTITASSSFLQEHYYLDGFLPMWACSPTLQAQREGLEGIEGDFYLLRS